MLQLCPPEAVYDGHSILLVGYRDEPAQPGGGVFLFRNTAGDGRDAAMPYAYASAYMNDAVWVDYPRRAARQEVDGRTELPAMNAVVTGLLAPPLGRNRRLSSNELPKWNDANLDMTLLPPGQSIEMPVLEGPGVITHLWFTSHAGRVNELL